MEHNNMLDIYRSERFSVSLKNAMEYKGATGDNYPMLLLQYISHQSQHDYFRYGIIDPEKVAETMGLRYQTLMTKHENPLQRKVYGNYSRSGSQHAAIKKDQYEWATNLENALYALYMLPINLYVTYYNDSNKPSSLSKGQRAIRVIDSLEAKVVNNYGKVVYFYILNETFRRNFLHYYREVSLTSMIAAQRSNITALYVKLIDFRDNAYSNGTNIFHTEGVISFDSLCELAGLPKETRDGRIYEPRFKKSRLNKYFAQIGMEDGDFPDIRFDTVWEGPKKYSAAFVFPADESKMKGSMRFGDPYDKRRREAAIEGLRKEILFSIISSFEKPSDGNIENLESSLIAWLNQPIREQEDALQYQQSKLSLCFVNSGFIIPADMSRRTKDFNDGLISLKSIKDLIQLIDTMISSNVYTGIKYRHPGNEADIDEQSR